MAKYLQKAQIIGEKGVAAFHDYCANHVPPILWREETKHDFGIDGEIEIVQKTDNGQMEVTGEVLKVQIKSTETGSYISNETIDSFDFTGSLDDLEYWLNHKLAVVLVIYFSKHKTLYAKKIEQIDSEKTRKHYSMTFDKNATLLKFGENNFLRKYSQYFKGRVNWDSGETLYTNVFRFNKLPRYIYAYKSKVTDKQEIYQSGIKPLPDFILKSSRLFTFLRLDHFPVFCKEFVFSDPPEIILFNNFMRDKSTKHYSIELINKYFRDYCHKKGIGYVRDYNRYYFRKTSEQPLTKIETKSFLKEVYRINSYKPKSQIRQSIDRETVVRYTYHEKVDFFRHFAFEIYYFLDDNNFYLSITPKYFYTSDGRNVLEDKKRITRYTNYMTSREFNQQVLNHIYFTFQYLSDNKDYISLADFDNCTISVSKMIIFDVPFSIVYSASKPDLKDDYDNEHKIIQGLLDFENDGDYPS